MPRQGRRGQVKGIFGLVLKLEDVRLTRKRPSRRWLARCPCHANDAVPELIVAEDHRGDAWIYCTRRCSIEAILAKVGMHVSDVFANGLPTIHVLASGVLASDEYILIERLQEESQQARVATMGGVGVPGSERRH